MPQGHGLAAPAGLGPCGADSAFVLLSGHATAHFFFPIVTGAVASPVVPR